MRPVEQIASLLEGSIDVAYMVGTPRDPQLEARLVCREPNFIIMSAHHPLASKDSLTMEDLTGCTVLIPSEFKSERLGKQNLEAAGFEGIGAKAHFFDGAFSHIVERVRMNEGLWCAGESFCQSVNPNGLVFRPHPNPQVFSEHYLAYKKEARISGGTPRGTGRLCAGRPGKPGQARHRASPAFVRQCDAPPLKRTERPRCG